MLFQHMRRRTLLVSLHDDSSSGTQCGGLITPSIVDAKCPCIHNFDANVSSAQEDRSSLRATREPSGARQGPGAAPLRLDRPKRAFHWLHLWKLNHLRRYVCVGRGVRACARIIYVCLFNSI